VARARPTPPSAAPSTTTPVAPLLYKFVELSIVTDETLEECVNEWVAQGWIFDGVRFVMTEASRRPAMAFVSFVSAPASPSASTPRRRR